MDPESDPTRENIHTPQATKTARSFRGAVPQALQSFHFRDYRWLWLGTFFSFMAIGMQQITRGWLILRLTDDSPFALSLVMMSFALPLTFASVIGGALADRISRRRMIMLTQAGNAFLTLLLAVLDMTGIVRFWHLMVLGFCNGTMAALNMPSRQSLISEIVPDESLMNAISLSSAGMNLTRIIGPVLAGVLIIFIETAGVFYLIAVLYALAVLCTAVIRTGRTPAARGPRKGMTADIREGFRYAAKNPTILALVFMAFVPALFGFPYLALLPAWGREIMDIQSDGLGVLMTFVGIGSLAGALILASFNHLKRRGLFLVANGFIWGISLVLLAFCTTYATALPALFLIGFLSAVFMSLNMTLMQFYSSAEMRGRIVSMAMMTFGIMPLSAVPFGALAESIGTADSLAIGGLFLCLFVAGFYFVFPRFREVT